MRHSLCLIMFVTATCFSTASTYNWSNNPGNGDPNSPYQITTAEQLLSMNSRLDKWFILMADIDLDISISSEYNFHQSPIGTSTPFTGNFNGNDHCISNLHLSVNGTNSDGLGLFGFVGTNASIYDLQLIDPSISIVNSSLSCVGCLAGSAFQASIRNCEITNASITGTADKTGGVIGLAYECNIENCEITGFVTGGDYVGGMAGNTRDCQFSRCIVNATVKGQYICGGLIGYDITHSQNMPWGVISNCSTSGQVLPNDEWLSGKVSGGLMGTNNSYVVDSSSKMDVTGLYANGGLVGANYKEISSSYAFGTITSSGSNHYDGWIGTGGLVAINGSYPTMAGGVITNCYASGNITAAEYGGGLAGRNHGTIANSYSTGLITCNLYTGGLTGANTGTVNQSYWDIETSGMSESNGGTGLESKQMKQQESFEGWDFVKEWNIGENQTYPYLRTYLAGDLNSDNIVNLNDLVILSNEWLAEK